MSVSATIIKSLSALKNKKNRDFFKKLSIGIIIFIIVLIGTFFTICLALVNACTDVFYWIFGGIFGDVEFDAGSEYTEEISILNVMEDSFAKIDAAVENINKRIGIVQVDPETHEDDPNNNVDPETAEAEENQEEEPEPEEETESIEPETSAVIENTIDGDWVKAVYYSIYCDHTINGDDSFFSSFAECFVSKTEGKNNKIIEKPQENDSELFAELSEFLNIEITTEISNRAYSLYSQIPYL